jgi:hypothetical protein
MSWIVALCKKQFLHIEYEGVENVKCLEEKRTRQFVLIVGRNVKFPSNPTQVGLFTAESAGQKEEDKGEGTRLSQQP